jgi:hypothetical protein
MTTTTDAPGRDPAPDIKRRILESVRAEPAPTHGAVQRQAWLALGACAAIALAIFVHFGGVRLYDRPTPLVVWTSLGWSAAASAAAWSGLARRRSMLGRTTATLVATIVAIPPVLLAWKIGVTASFGPEMMEPWPTRPGFRCLGLSIAMAFPLLAAFLLFRRRSDPVHPGIAGAALGITAGVFAGTFVDLWCPVAYVPHVLLGHILPLVVVSAAGALAGRTLLRP